MKKKYVIEQANDEFYTPHAGLAFVGTCINRFTSLAPKTKAAVRQENGVPHIDILRSYLGLLAIGKSDYEAISGMKEDIHFRNALGIRVVPSTETLRQQMDEHAAAFLPAVNGCVVEFISRAKAAISALETGHVPLDIDVFAMDNSKTKKEGVSRTYHNYDGYAPIAAYLGLEGWCLEIEFRPGSQHSQNNFIPYFKRVIVYARSLTNKPLLARLDSAHDSIETRVTTRQYEKVSYILKWNPRKETAAEWYEYAFANGRVSVPRPGKKVVLFTKRIQQEYEGKTYVFTRVMRLIERTIDKHGQILLAPELEIEGWWTSLDLPEEKVIRLYENHGLSEQFHSEIKTDLDLERLPSGKFATNALVMSLAALIYNILRFIGLRSLLGPGSPVRHEAKRRRIKTVIQELVYIAARLVSSGRRLTLRLSRHCQAYGVFKDLYAQLALG